MGNEEACTFFAAHRLGASFCDKRITYLLNVPVHTPIKPLLYQKRLPTMVKCL